MKWYIAKIVFQIVNNSNIQQFDEQVRIIKAADIEDAFCKANDIAKAEENEFSDFYNNKVNWKFVAVPYLSELSSLEHGTELCSQIIEKEPKENYLYSIKLKQEEIKRKAMQTIESQ